MKRDDPLYSPNVLKTARKIARRKPALQLPPEHAGSWRTGYEVGFVAGVRYALLKQKEAHQKRKKETP